MIQLKISSLEFDDIKNNIKAYFKQDTKYSDYNYEGSNLSTLLNILAYNSHYIGYYIKMVLNESFIDTAQTKAAMISHAKKMGYTIKNKMCAYASVSVTVNGVPDSVKFLTIPTGTSFPALSSSDTKKVFVTTNDYTIKNIGGKFKLDNIIIYQGNIIQNTYVVSDNKQTININDLNCDINTLSVYVKNSVSSTVRTKYSPVVDIIDVDQNANVWYSKMVSDGSYEIYFGENLFGNQPKINQYIDVEFISTLGNEGNNITNFKISPIKSTNVNNIGYYSDIEVNTIEQSSGGVDAQSIEDLRFAIPNYNRRQKRIVNENDYKSALLDEFGDVESISVYGGEKATEVQYAKMVVAIKPYNSDNLSETAKTLIRNNLVKKYGIVGSNIIFVKPDYINLDVVVYIKKNRLSIIDNDQIESEVTIKAEDYNRTVLNKFESMYSDNDFITFIKDDVDYISSIYTKKVINKKLTFDKGLDTRYLINMSNAVTDMRSTVFEYGIYHAYFKNDGENIYVYDSTTNLKLSELILGNISFDSGVITLDIPKDIYNQYIEISCTPSTPDIETTLNNIVRFNNISIRVT